MEFWDSSSGWLNQYVTHFRAPWSCSPGYVSVPTRLKLNPLRVFRQLARPFRTAEWAAEHGTYSLQTATQFLQNEKGDCYGIHIANLSVSDHLQQFVNRYDQNIDLFIYV